MACHTGCFCEVFGTLQRVLNQRAKVHQAALPVAISSLLLGSDWLSVWRAHRPAGYAATQGIGPDHPRSSRLPPSGHQASRPLASRYAAALWQCTQLQAWRLHPLCPRDPLSCSVRHPSRVPLLPLPPQPVAFAAYDGYRARPAMFRGETWKVWLVCSDCFLIGERPQPLC